MEASKCDGWPLIKLGAPHQVLEEGRRASINPMSSLNVGCLKAPVLPQEWILMMKFSWFGFNPNDNVLWGRHAFDKHLHSLLQDTCRIALWTHWGWRPEAPLGNEIWVILTQTAFLLCAVNCSLATMMVSCVSPAWVKGLLLTHYFWVCLQRCFQRRSAFESFSWVKTSAFTKVGAAHLCRPEYNKKVEKGQLLLRLHDMGLASHLPPHEKWGRTSHLSHSLPPDSQKLCEKACYFKVLNFR